MATEIATQHGNTYGPFRAPANPMRESTGTIHDEQDARRLGFRGGLVAGSIHMEQFAPLLVHAFGEEWLESGTISLYFLTPTVHGEQVRAVFGVPHGPDAQVEAWMETQAGTRICEGTASIGTPAAGMPAAPSALHARDLDRHGRGEPRILADAQPGDEFPVVDTSVPQALIDERLAVITEPMPWYSDAARWGGTVPTTVNQVNALIAPQTAYLRNLRAGAIGLYGAIELRNVHGPMLADTSYRAGGAVLHVGETPKTEYIWFDTWTDDEASNRIAEMRMMLRFMKASSPLYGDDTASSC